MSIHHDILKLFHPLNMTLNRTIRLNPFRILYKCENEPRKLFILKYAIYYNKTATQLNLTTPINDHPCFFRLFNKSPK